MDWEINLTNQILCCLTPSRDLNRMDLNLSKPWTHLERAPDGQTLKPNPHPFLPTMWNNLMAINERKQNRNTTLVERQFKVRGTQSQHSSVRALASPRRAKKRHDWALTAYKAHFSVNSVYLALTGESIAYLIVSSRAVKRYFSKRMKSCRSYRYGHIKDFITHEGMDRC